jgi:hypothetical protein
VTAKRRQALEIYYFQLKQHLQNHCSTIGREAEQKSKHKKNL